MISTQIRIPSARFDFLGVRTNQEIPEQRFVYVSPASANVYRDFLFDSED